MISDAALADLKRDHPVAEVAGQWVKLRKHGRGYIGPCPFCSKNPDSKTDGRFEVPEPDRWVCAACPDGGDVIALVMRRDGVDFREAVSRLGGITEREPNETDAARAGRAARRRGAERHVPAEWGPFPAAWLGGWDAQEAAEASNAEFRAKEIERCRGFWTSAWRVAGSPVEEYLAIRRIGGMTTDALRCHPRMPYFVWDEVEKRPRLIHTGPAMLAPILGWPSGAFTGLHITWIDLARSNGKAELFHPDTGEELPAKKVRGSKAGGFIPITPLRGRTRMVAGEGIETTGSAEVALKDVGEADDVAFVCGIDLGNLTGPAVESVPHPTIRRPDKAGRMRVWRVPGPEPDMSAPAMPVPDEITDLVLLWDGDSEPFLTKQAMLRAQRRFARPGRVVRPMLPGAGIDCNDVMREEAL